MKQSDPRTRMAAAEVIDALGGGACILAPNTRMNTEVAYFIYAHASNESLHPLITWCGPQPRTCSVWRTRTTSGSPRRVARHSKSVPRSPVVSTRYNCRNDRARHGVINIPHALCQRGASSAAKPNLGSPASGKVNVPQQRSQIDRIMPKLESVCCGNGE